MIDHLPAGEDDLLVRAGVSKVRKPRRERAFARSMLNHRLNQPVGQVAAGSGKNRARADGGVTDPQAKDGCRTAKPPVRGIDVILGTGLVDKRFEGVASDLFGECLGGVLSTHVASRRCLSDKHRAREEHDRQAAEIRPDDPPVREYTSECVVVVAAGDARRARSTPSGCLARSFACVQVSG